MKYFHEFRNLPSQEETVTKYYMNTGTENIDVEISEKVASQIPKSLIIIKEVVVNRKSQIDFFAEYVNQNFKTILEGDEEFLAKKQEYEYIAKLVSQNLPSLSVGTVLPIFTASYQNATYSFKKRLNRWLRETKSYVLPNPDLFSKEVKDFYEL